MSKEELLLTYWSDLAADAQDQLLSIARSMAVPTHSQQPDTEEARLVAVINQRFSADEQRRLNELRDRNEAGMITDAEHQELLDWIDRVEARDVDRAEAMIQLARSRGVDLDVVVAEFLPAHVGV
jgi:hypothetical protein